MFKFGFLSGVGVMVMCFLLVFIVRLFSLKGWMISVLLLCSESKFWCRFSCSWLLSECVSMVWFFVMFCVVKLMLVSVFKLNGSLN